MSDRLTAAEVKAVEALAYVIRDEAYPEFRHSPPPEWATRAAKAVIRFHQPLIRDALLSEAAARAVDEALSVVKYQADRICVTFRGHEPPTCETHWSEWPMGADMCEWRQTAAALVAHLRGPR